jgi:hypothetical protein
MNKIHTSLVGVLCLTLSPCRAGEKNVSGCDARKSDMVFAGEFKIDEVKSIGIVPSKQKSIYPIPDINHNKTWKFTDRPDFIEKFKKSLVSPVNRKEILNPGFHTCFHIYVLFHSGKSACFLGRMGSSGFIIQPMFDRDSYTSNNNEVYNLFASEFMVAP